MTDPAEEDNSPSRQQGDSLRTLAAEHAPRGELANRILGAVEAMHASGDDAEPGDDAEQRHERALAALREEGAEAVIAMSRLECGLPRRDYATRWALVHLIAELHEPTALPLLRQLVLTPLPPEEAKDPHSSTVAEETIIRTTAVDGVSALAKDGNEEAVDSLLEFFQQPSFSVRRAAVQGLLATPKGDDFRERIGECLPKDQRFLLELQKLDVRKAPQVEDPQQHLSERGKADAKPAAPDITDRSEEDRSIVGLRAKEERGARGAAPRGGDSESEEKTESDGC